MRGTHIRERCSAREIFPLDGCQCAAPRKSRNLRYKDEDNGNENDNYDSKHEFIRDYTTANGTKDDDLAAKMREEIAWQALYFSILVFAASTL